jgi:hypothetical protein
MQGGLSALRCDDPRPLVAVGAGCPRGPTSPLTFARNILVNDTVFHDEDDTTNGFYIFQWIAVESDGIG